VPTIYLAGDSTVVDQAKEPWTAWGQILPVFFNDRIAIANEAESGETIRSFVGEGRLAKIMSTIHAGDYLFVQFAHNDQKLGSGFVSIPQYKDYLRSYIDQARAKGATPILVTSMNRRTFDDKGKIQPSLGEYPAAMRDVAAEKSVDLIDLNAMSKTLYEALGPQTSLKVFVHYPANSFPGQPQELKDDTHFSGYGAYELARAIVSRIQEMNLPLANYLRRDIAPFDLSHPDPVETFNLPASPFVSAATPYELSDNKPAAIPQEKNATVTTDPGQDVQFKPTTEIDPKLPTIWLVGDSTVRNGHGDGANNQMGWGDELASFFDLSKVNVINRAIGGRSSRTYITEGRWDEVLSMMKPGDIVLIQFGHNDPGPLDDAARARGSLAGVGDETREIENPVLHRHETVHTFGWYMTKYVQDAKAHGVIPILCSQIPRKIWNGDTIIRSTSSYAGWTRTVAETEHVAFVDLNEIIARRYDSMGKAAVEPLFGDEHTHTTALGATLNAEAVVAGLKALKDDPVAKDFSPRAGTIPPFNAAK
jgi:rhamnogalacturonan acetylesterase